MSDEPIENTHPAPEPDADQPAGEAPAAQETSETGDIASGGPTLAETLQAHRKTLTIALLAICNLVAVAILATFEPPAEIQTADLATIDLAIEEKLKEYNLPPRQIKVENVRVDSQFTRRVVRTGIPKGVSRTLIHLELNEELAALGVRMPAVVKFPERDLNVHFMLGGTIVRTLIMRSDTSLKVLSYPGSVVFFADGDPDTEALEALRNFGDVHLIAGRVESLSEAESFMAAARGNNQNRILMWVDGSEMPGYKFDRFFNELIENLRKSAPNARLLLFGHAQTSGNRSLWKTVEALEWPVLIAPTDAIQPGGLDEEAFLRTLERFNKDALTGQRDLLILPLRADYVEWMKQNLPEFKKSGLRLVEPKPIKL